MGASKESSTTSSNQSSTPTPTAEETALNKLDLEARQANQQGLIGTQKAGLNLSQLLLQGQNLPGYLGSLTGGIDENMTQQMVNQSLRDIQPGFQQAGLLDSGVRASISARTAGDIRMGSAQFNIQNLHQLLNMALGGQSQVQQPILGQGAALGSRLAGLRSQNQTGTSNSQSMSKQNPFMQGASMLSQFNPYAQISQGIGFGTRR